MRASQRARFGAVLSFWLLIFISPARAVSDCMRALLESRGLEQCAEFPEYELNFRQEFAAELAPEHWPQLIASVKARFLTGEQRSPALQSAQELFARELDTLLLHPENVDSERARLPELEKLSDAELTQRLRTAHAGTFGIDASAQGRFVLFASAPEPIVVFDFEGEAGLPLSEDERTRLALLAKSFEGLVNQSLSGARQLTLAAIRDAQADWQGFLSDVGSDQLAWESLFNQLLGRSGTLDNPPSWQWRLLHPSVGIELGPGELTQATRIADLELRRSVGVEILGFRRYRRVAHHYKPTYGLSLYTTHSEGIDVLGIGGLLRLSDVGSIGYVQRGAGIDKGFLVFDVNLYPALGKFIGGAQALVADHRLERLGEFAQRVNLLDARP